MPITETSCCATALSPTGRGDRLPNIIVHTLFTSIYPPFSRGAELRIVSPANRSKRKVVAHPEIFFLANSTLCLTELGLSAQPRFSLSFQFATCSSAITTRSGGVRKTGKRRRREADLRLEGRVAADRDIGKGALHVGQRLGDPPLPHPRWHRTRQHFPTGRQPCREGLE